MLVVALALSGCNALTGVGDLGTAPAAPDLGGMDGGREGTGDGGNDGPGVVDGAPTPYHDASTTDDAAADDSDATTVEAGADSGVKRVFVTSTMTQASLGGLAGGDLQCSQRASAAKLGGTWRAWLSTNATNATSRITASGPWYLTTGVLAVRVGELTKGHLTRRIDRDENGAQQSGLVWTATDADGTFLDDDCGDWTSNAASGHAATGDTRTASPAWTAAVPADCNATRRLYCFEQ